MRKEVDVINKRHTTKIKNSRADNNNVETEDLGFLVEISDEI